MNHPSGMGTPVKVLIVDKDNAQRHNICLYARYQQEVELCGAVASGRRALELLEAEAPPDVMVLDTLVQDMDLFSLMDRLGRLRLRRRPAVILTVSNPSQEVQQKLLTLGADFIILKPYRLEMLFRSITVLGAQAEELSARQVNHYINWYMEALRANFSFTGDTYIAAALREFVPAEGSFNAEEIYQRVGALEQVSEEGVRAAIHRAICRMQKQGSEQYSAMCRYYGRPPTRVLSNGEFLFRLIQMIRQELCL